MVRGSNPSTLGVCTLTASVCGVRVGSDPLQGARGAGRAPSGLIVALSPFSFIMMDVCVPTILKVNR